MARILSALGMVGMIMLSMPAQAQDEIVISDVGFALPESMRYDAENDRYIVANIGGNSGNDGFISIVSPDGTLEELKWIAGGENGVELIDPKGTRVHEGELYVADVQAIQIFDLETGEPTRSIPIEGAVSLNDLAIAEDGTIFVTDRGSRQSTEGAIYRVDPDGAITELDRGEDLMNPNGITLSPEGKVVSVTVGAADVVTREPDGTVIDSWTLETGQLDGVLYLPDGRLLVTSWEAEAVLVIGPDGSQTALIEGISSPAAMDFDPTRNVILMPQLMQNTVRLIPLP